MQKTFDIDGPAQIEVRLASGEIVVDPTLEGQIEVELTAHDDESQRLVDDARVELNDAASDGRRAEQARRLQLLARLHPPGDHLPDPLSAFVGALRADEVGGCRRPGNARRAERLDRVGRRRSESRRRRRQHQERERRHARPGDLGRRERADARPATSSSKSCAGPVNVNSASGDVTIGEAYDNVSANTVSGDQEHGAVMRGSVSAHSVSGDVTIGVRRGSKVYLDCNTRQR